MANRLISPEVHPDSHIVEEKHYSTRVTPLEPDFVLLERQHFWKTDTVQFDVFPTVWSLYIFQPRQGQISIVYGDRTISIDRPSALLIPPFALVQTKISMGRSDWIAYNSTQPFIDQVVNDARLFPWSDKKVHFDQITQDILKLSQLKNLVKCRMANGSRLASTQSDSSSLAGKAKNTIDQRYRDSLAIAKIADILGVSTSTLGQAFRRRYGLSMTAYRKKLRIVHSAYKMFENDELVIDSCYNSGFDDLGKYYQDFAKLIGNGPAKYRRSRR